MEQKRMFVFIDLEMTGLDIQKDVILEAALIITDSDCQPVHEPISYVIAQPEPVLSQMNDWCKTMHAKSGLVEEVLHSNNTPSFVCEQFIKRIKQFAPDKSGILAGNSVWQDRLFLAKFMPEILQLLHYRLLDVSSIKELFHAWKTPQQKEFKKKETHRALSDIEETIAELKYYKTQLF